jgi:poly-gamma-glutamate synthesis protein (capsule biosynthesis protein)
VPSDDVTLFLAGDVMLGRGIDQILPHPGDAQLFEPSVTSAVPYVDLAEAANGPIPRPVDFAYVWGDALIALQAVQPDVRIVNLETSITKSRKPYPKGINYKMNPDNVACLRAMRVNCCALANNHIMDWGQSGLVETVETLERAHIACVGAGRDTAQAKAPAIVNVDGRASIVVFAFGSSTSGVPKAWAAGDDRAGTNFLGELSDPAIAAIAAQTRPFRRPGMSLVASIHWGDNWGYAVPDEQRRFAHRLIDDADFNIVHGHSAHHAKAIEVYRERLILYGCGDFINDYEGIGGYERFRADLAVMYLARCSGSRGNVSELRMVPFQIRKFSLHRASKDDTEWLRATLDRESSKFGTRITIAKDNILQARW